MSRSIEPARLYQGRTRREALGVLGAGAVSVGMDLVAGSAQAQDGENVLTEALVLRDPEIPVARNSGGDITIVEYFDYQCPYCRKIEPELRQAVPDDGKVRLVLKDWPILGPVSIIATRIVPASKYPDQFTASHDALIGVNSNLTEPPTPQVLPGA